jgi:hypothetical protein
MRLTLEVENTENYNEKREQTFNILDLNLEKKSEKKQKTKTKV